MRASRLIFLFTCWFALMACAAAQTPKQALLVLSKTDHTLAIVNPATLQVVARVPVGPDPHEVIASADGQMAYVSNYGFGKYHTLARIDLIHHKQLSYVDLGPLTGPHGLEFTHGEVWFTAEGAKVIGRYDPATDKVDWVMGTGQNRTHMLHVFPDMQRIVTTNVASGSVTILDHTTGQHGPMPTPPGGDWNETVVKVGKGSEGFDVSPDGKEMWVANAEGGTISVIDLTAKKVVATLDANVPSANRLKFTLDGKLALVSLLRGPDLVILDAATRTVVKRLPIGHGAAGVLMDPNGKRAYVSCGPDNDVAVIDLKTLTVAAHVDAGGNPDGLAWAVQR